MHKQVSAITNAKRSGSCPLSSNSNAVRRSYKLPVDEQSRHVFDFFAALDHPISLSCAILYRAGEFKQLVEKDVVPSDFEDPADFRSAFAAISFLRKYPSFKTGIDTKEVALSSFYESEQKCKVINKAFDNGSWVNTAHDSWLLNATMRKISKILRAVNENDLCQGFDIDRVLHKCSWGPGSTMSITGRDTSSSIKFQEERNLTRDMYALYGPTLAAAYPGWIPDLSDKFEFVQGNKIVTVPKNAKTDRTIAIEPGINSFVQLGIGRLIRSRLRSAGYDLNSDEKNRSGALKGSIDGSLATVDFSSASDTISRGVVETLLPPVWFSAMDAARSHYYTLNGTDFTEYAKFSTMGCGFTFELESLIFLSAALAVCEYLHIDTDSVAIFGDDVIIPSVAFDVYASFCATLGFTVNKRKSFSAGCFRESCGSYYFRGVDVKPLFLKQEVRTLNQILSFANAVRGFSHSKGLYPYCESRFRTLWLSIARNIPRTFMGPRSAGDLCLSVNFDEATPKIARSGLEGFIYSGWVPKAVEVQHDSNGHLLAKLSSCGKWPIIQPFERVIIHPSILRACALELKSLPSAFAAGNDVPFRRVVRYSRKDRMIAPQWYNFGPWL